MSFGYILEIFGGTGAVILGVGTCIWGFCKTHQFKYDYDEEDKLDPVDVLNEEWESPGENFPIEEQFGSNWSRLKFAKKEDGNWKVNINKKEGNVYIYSKKDRLPPKCNDRNHFLRINIKNVKKNMKIKFQQKFFDISYNQIKDTNCKFIKKDGEHIFEPECIIDLQNTNKDSVKLEQVGVYISGEFQDIKDIIIDEAYYGEKWSFCKLCCCRRHCKTILCRRKSKDD